MKAWQGLGTKGRLGCKHRWDIVSHISLAFLPQGAAGAGKERSGAYKNIPALAEEKSVLMIASKMVFIPSP